MERLPEHVPPELVTSFSLYSSPEMVPTPMGDPQAAAAKALLAGPPIVYTPLATRDGVGAWVVTRAEDQRRVLQDGVTFSSFRNTFSAAIGESWPLIPLEIDPPDHSAWRSLLNPLLSPRRVVALEGQVRARAVELIEGIKARGTDCDVMTDFAFPFAVNIFLQFLGIPDDRLMEFVGWANDMLHSTPEARTAAAHKVLGFLDELADLRRREPADDFMTFVLNADIFDRKMTPHEVRAMSILLFIGGLDTVAAAIGFDLYHLARFPEDQKDLRENPQKILLAAEEFLRAYATITPLRTVTADVDVNGVLMKKGDIVSCPSMVANRDPMEFPNPDKIDLQREDNRHTAFAYGPHRCLGSHLARREIVVGLEEFLARIPDFRIKPGTTPMSFGGYVFGVENLILDWSA
jgi:cytochrome P450